MRIRRVVAGTEASSSAVVVSDEMIDPITVGMLPGAEFFSIWAGDSISALPHSCHADQVENWFPPPGGFRFVVVTLGVDADVAAPGSDPSSALHELDRKLPGTREILGDASGFHGTDTVDFVALLSGEITLCLEGAKEVPLRAGDTAVLAGVRHSWRVNPSERCIMAIALVGATRS